MRPTPAVPAATVCRQLVTQSPFSPLPGERRCLSSALCSLVTGAPRRHCVRRPPPASVNNPPRVPPARDDQQIVSQNQLDFSHRTHVRAARPAPRAHMATVTRAGRLRRRRVADSNRRCPRHRVPPHQILQAARHLDPAVRIEF